MKLSLDQVPMFSWLKLSSVIFHRTAANEMHRSFV